MHEKIYHTYTAGSNNRTISSGEGPEMKRATVAACFSAAFCTIGAALYYAVAFSLMAHRFSLRGFVSSLAAAGITAFFVAGPFSFCLGFFGGWILPKLPFAAKRVRFVSAAILLGGILSCVFPVLLPDRESQDDLALTWLPALLIGMSCAGLWAWFWALWSHDNSTSGGSVAKGDG
jgi:hypothetical protein